MATIVKISRTTKHHEDVLKIERIEPEGDSRTTYVLPIDGSVEIDVFGENVSELIERDTPKRMEKIGRAHYCPVCHRFIPDPLPVRFCDWCGKRFEIESCPKVF